MQGEAGDILDEFAYIGPLSFQDSFMFDGKVHVYYKL
jgi:hypothetical protein